MKVYIIVEVQNNAQDENGATLEYEDILEVWRSKGDALKAVKKLNRDYPRDIHRYLEFDLKDTLDE